MFPIYVFAQSMTGLFYVQDERYVVMPWMAMNNHVQDERYVVMPWMAMNNHVQRDGLRRWITHPATKMSCSLSDIIPIPLYIPITIQNAGFDSFKKHIYCVAES